MTRPGRPKKQTSEVPLRHGDVVSDPWVRATMIVPIDVKAGLVAVAEQQGVGWPDVARRLLMDWYNRTEATADSWCDHVWTLEPALERKGNDYVCRHCGHREGAVELPLDVVKRTRERMA